MANKQGNNNAESGAGVFGLRLDAFFWRRVALLLIVVGALFLVLWSRLLPEKVNVRLGQPAPKQILAPWTARYIDSEATEKMREEARRRVPPVFRRDDQAAAIAEHTVADVFAAIREARRDPNLRTLADKLVWLHDQLDVRVSDDTYMLGLQASEGALERMEEAAAEIVRKLMRVGVLQPSGAVPTAAGGPKTSGRAGSKSPGVYPDLAQARKRAREMASELPFEPAYCRAIADVAAAALRPNVFVDEQATQKAIEKALAQVKRVRRTVAAGTLILDKGDIVTQRHLDMLEALGMIHPRLDYTRAVSLLVLVTLIVVGYGAFVYFFAPEYYTEEKYLFVAAILVVGGGVAYRAAQGTSAFEAVSLAAAVGAAIAMCLLAVPVVAVALGATLSLVLGLVALGNEARLVIAALLATVIVVFAMGRGYQRTSMIARTAVIAAIINSLLLVVANQVYLIELSWKMVAYTALAGLLGASAGTGFVLVLQRPLAITTDLWLLELGNPNEPILRRLLTEAPGTYQSCLLVSALAEAAAEAIGANSLVARTAALYHDIGKLKRPGFFIENQFGGQNPHDKFAPQLSAMILSAHVTDGVEMARQLRLPPEIISAIAEHHGTTLMRYFYEKAKQQARPGEEVAESKFRYPGPKPRTRENAIIMLADSVEAAARTLDSYDPHTIRQMVERIVQDRVEDGQLDESPLTMAELRAVKEQLAQTLVSMFHTRIPYPEQVEREMKARESASKRRAPLEHPGAPSAGSESDNASGNNR